MKPPLYCVLLLSWLMSVQAMAQSLFDGTWKIDLNESAPSTILQRTDPLPATGIGSHQAEIIHHNLRRESCVAFVAVGVFPKPRVALR